MKSSYAATNHQTLSSSSCQLTPRTAQLTPQLVPDHIIWGLTFCFPMTSPSSLLHHSSCCSFTCAATVPLPLVLQSPHMDAIQIAAGSRAKILPALRAEHRTSSRQSSSKHLAELSLQMPLGTAAMRQFPPDHRFLASPTQLLCMRETVLLHH